MLFIIQTQCVLLWMFYTFAFELKTESVDLSMVLTVFLNIVLSSVLQVLLMLHLKLSYVSHTVFFFFFCRISFHRQQLFDLLCICLKSFSRLSVYRLFVLTVFISLLQM